MAFPQYGYRFIATKNIAYGACLNAGLRTGRVGPRLSAVERAGDGLPRCARNDGGAYLPPFGRTTSAAAPTAEPAIRAVPMAALAAKPAVPMATDATVSIAVTTAQAGRLTANDTVKAAVISRRPGCLANGVNFVAGRFSVVIPSSQCLSESACPAARPAPVPAGRCRGWIFRQHGWRPSPCLR